MNHRKLISSMPKKISSIYSIQVYNLFTRKPRRFKSLSPPTQTFPVAINMPGGSTLCQTENQILGWYLVGWSHHGQIQLGISNGTAINPAMMSSFVAALMARNGMKKSAHYYFVIPPRPMNNAPILAAHKYHGSHRLPSSSPLIRTAPLLAARGNSSQSSSTSSSRLAGSLLVPLLGTGAMANNHNAILVLCVAIWKYNIHLLSTSTAPSPIPNWKPWQPYRPHVHYSLAAAATTTPHNNQLIVLNSSHLLSIGGAIWSVSIMSSSLFDDHPSVPFIKSITELAANFTDCVSPPCLRRSW